MHIAWKHSIYYSVQCNKVIGAWLFIQILMLMVGCELFSQTLALTVVVPHISEMYDLEGLHDTFTRTVFFIDDMGSAHRSIPGALGSSASILIEVGKTRVIPVLVCGEIVASIATEQVYDTQHCLFAQGGVYPFDGNNATLYVSPRHTAQVASLLLDLYEKGARIELLNVAKLYASIQSRSPNAPFDRYRLYDYVNEGNISSWGITPLKAYTVQLSREALQSRTWVNLSFWGDAVIGDDFAIDLYPGKWVFVSHDDADVHTDAPYTDVAPQVYSMNIYIDAAGTYQVVPADHGR